MQWLTNGVRNIDPLIYLVDGVLVVLALNQYLCMLLAIVLSVKAWKERKRPHEQEGNARPC